jgi:hypothetical protein
MRVTIEAYRRDILHRCRVLRRHHGHAGDEILSYDRRSLDVPRPAGEQDSRQALGLNIFEQGIVVTITPMIDTVVERDLACGILAEFVADTLQRFVVSAPAGLLRPLREYDGIATEAGRMVGDEGAQPAAGVDERVTCECIERFLNGHATGVETALDLGADRQPITRPNLAGSHSLAQRRSDGCLLCGAAIMLYFNIHHGYNLIWR